MNIKKYEVFAILLAYFLTQSSTGYITIFFALILINSKQINFKKAFLIISLTPVLLFSLYTLSTKFQDRLDSSIGLLTGKIILDSSNPTNEANGSSLILFNHFIVAQKNASAHWFGTGPGSHHLAFERYNTLRIHYTGYGKNGIVLNLHDASSLFNRILSEFGYIGVLLVFIFIYKNFIKSGSNYLQLINHSSLVMLFIMLLRGGHYFLFALPFFILNYYYSCQFNKQYTLTLKVKQS